MPQRSPRRAALALVTAAAALVLLLPGAAACRSARGPAAAAAAAPPPPSFEAGVTLRIERTGDAGLLSFGLPVPPGAVRDPRTIRVSFGGAEVDARVEELLAVHDRSGVRASTRALLVQLRPPTDAPAFDLRIDWAGGSRRAPGARVPFSSPEVSRQVDETVETAARTLARARKGAALVEVGRATKRLFSAREAHYAVLHPEGYLAATGLLGRLTPARAVPASLAGLRFLSEGLRDFALASTYDDPYPLDPSPESVPDPGTNYEGWLYDRCATFLLAYAQAGDRRLERHGLRSCSWYGAHVRPDGIFTGRPDPDPKYSHVRGLYAYYALTGDEAAFAAGRAVAELWLQDRLFVAPYRAGRTRGPDKLWTERLLGTALEGLWYGHALTGDRRYLVAFQEVFETAYRHVTGDARELERINPGAGFPPQDCFVHNAEQQGEGNAQDPWCSGWMSVLVVDPLLRYQEQTGDLRVDEVFIRMARFLRDTGTSYFDKNPVDDTFLAPSTCDDPSDVYDRRKLVPIYGAGIGRDGRRKRFAEFEDYQHCPDVTAVTAAALRALRRRGTFDANPVGPFKSEGESLLVLHAELASCARRVLQGEVRPKRNPATWTPRELEAGLVDPAKFLRDNKIGFPSHNLSPQRRLSWWFNASMEQFALLREAGVTIDELRPGRIKGPPCRR
jgi:hypothetical protein